jgi:hypothetical protein
MLHESRKEQVAVSRFAVVAPVVKFGKLAFGRDSKGCGFFDRGHTVTLIVAQFPKLVTLAHNEPRHRGKPSVLVFLSFFLVFLVPERYRLHMGNVGVEPLMAPKPPEDGHPPDPILAYCNLLESATARDNFAIKKTVYGFLQKRDHGRRSVQAG